MAAVAFAVDTKESIQRQMAKGQRSKEFPSFANSRFCELFEFPRGEQKQGIDIKILIKSQLNTALIKMADKSFLDIDEVARWWLVLGGTENKYAYTNK